MGLAGNGRCIHLGDDLDLDLGVKGKEMMLLRDNILVDIDHVLSNAFWRDPMIGSVPWDEYHAAGKGDAPIYDVVDMINDLSTKYNIIALTARPGKWHKQTMEWCLRHRVMVQEILMRPDEDYRPAPQLKMALAKERFAPYEIKDCVAFLLDDREDVCAAFRAIGVTTLQVHARRDDTTTHDEHGIATP